MPPALPLARVWDLPTRLFHWLLAACVVGAVVSAKIGGNAMEWHFRCGYATLALLLFRLVWGVVGGHWSRFAQFTYSPRALWQYLTARGSPPHHFQVGHSPLGALSVFAMLAILLLQAATGLIADDEIASTGPLQRFVSGATSALATGWHKGWGQWAVLGLVGLHLIALLFYRVVRQRRLVRPMWTGDTPWPGNLPPSRDDTPSRLGAAAVMAVCAAFVAWLASLGSLA